MGRISGVRNQALATARGVLAHPGNRGRRLRAIGRVVGWQVWERLARRSLTIRFENMKLVCFPHEFSSTAVLYNGLPDWDEMHFVKAFLRSGDIVVDVGANVGVYSLLAASISGVQVVAFEPSSAAYAHLETNITRNDLAERVLLRNTAVGATHASGRLTVGAGTMNRLDDNALGGESIEVVRLDDEPALNNRVALLKIDVEGHELEVLEGGAELIASARPALLVEANDPDDLERWLAPRGYRFYRFDTDGCQLLPTDPREVANVIAVVDLENAQERLSDVTTRWR